MVLFHLLIENLQTSISSPPKSDKDSSHSSTWFDSSNKLIGARDDIHLLASSEFIPIFSFMFKISPPTTILGMEIVWYFSIIQVNMLRCMFLTCQNMSLRTTAMTHSFYIIALHIWSAKGDCVHFIPTAWELFSNIWVKKNWRRNLKCKVFQVFWKMKLLSV